MSVTFINAAEAADLIQDRSTVAIDGFIGFCLADDILTAIEKRYIREDHPRDLSEMSPGLAVTVSKEESTILPTEA